MFILCVELLLLTILCHSYHAFAAHFDLYLLKGTDTYM